MVYARYAKALIDEPSGEDKLRGKALKGVDQPTSVEHVEYEKKRDPDAELHLDDEEDDLYSDGLDIDDDEGPPAGTDGNR